MSHLVIARLVIDRRLAIVPIESPIDQSSITQQSPIVNRQSAILSTVPDTLADLLPRHRDPSNDDLLDRFLDFVAARGLTLYPAQEEAILALLEGRNVILNTPTGSGKSLVATALLFAALARGERAVCTFPIKALVNEKWMQLCREFGPEYIGLATGDAAVNRDAPILCCTAEILGNIALRHGSRADVQHVVFVELVA